MQVKDCAHLLHLWLTKRELESRRVKNRSFAGVDIKELDLIKPPSSEGPTVDSTPVATATKSSDGPGDPVAPTN